MPATVPLSCGRRAAASVAAGAHAPLLDGGGTSAAAADGTGAGDPDAGGPLPCRPAFLMWMSGWPPPSQPIQPTGAPRRCCWGQRHPRRAGLGLVQLHADAGARMQPW